MAVIWKGALAFGLVNISVELRSTVRAAETLSFRQLDRKHHKPIKMERVSSVDGKTVPWDDIVRGFEISKGKFVIVEDEDFAAAAPQMSRVIDLTDFVPADAIDPRYFDSPYFLVPQKGGKKAYALLRDAHGRTAHRESRRRVRPVEVQGRISDEAQVDHQGPRRRASRLLPNTSTSRRTPRCSTS